MSSKTLGNKGKLIDVWGMPGTATERLLARLSLITCSLQQREISGAMLNSTAGYPSNRGANVVVVAACFSLVLALE